MVFSSITFLFYFLPITLILYFICSFSRILQNIVLLVVSLLFYAWGEPRNVWILVFSILFNSLMGYQLSRGKKIKRKCFLIFTIAVNLGILFIYKYLGFVVGLLPENLQCDSMKIALPIGISFFTFQAISYVVDVYKGIVPAENPFYVGLYLSFFPQLIAGPIIQYKTIAGSIQKRTVTFNKLSLGISRFVVGVIKKVLLANCFAAIADNVFGWSSIGNDKYVVPAMLAWLGSIAYTLQIYYDFSAYSDMAIGLALCFGFKFGENFNYPYIATSIQDFWKRWHISLTDWFREYVYFPLGGSRTDNKDTMVRNLFIVWLLTGIWHGANWTFVLWGMLYFVIQLSERFFGYVDKMKYNWMKHLYTLFIVNFAWVLFRSDNLYQAGRFILNMFGLNRNGFYSGLAIILLKENWIFLLAGIIFATPVARKMNECLYHQRISLKNGVISVIYPVAIMLLFILSLGYLAAGNYNPFIYFNF
ncbi:MAG: MBOAT family protein [Lachnospiraceae bacterium]|nr:MBOAT family protein [Lachnospiraceae bacterium]